MITLELCKLHTPTETGKWGTLLYIDQDRKYKNKK